MYTHSLKNCNNLKKKIVVNISPHLFLKPAQFKSISIKSKRNQWLMVVQSKIMGPLHPFKKPTTGTVLVSHSYIAY